MNQSSDFWKSWTQARIGLDRTGHAISTSELLKLRWAHAMARDAVMSQWQVEKMHADLVELGEKVLILSSKTGSRDEYLKRPDLGRQLSRASQERLASLSVEPLDVVFIISDGLSPTAVEKNVIGFWSKMRIHLKELKL